MICVLLVNHIATCLYMYVMCTIFPFCVCVRHVCVCLYVCEGVSCMFLCMWGSVCFVILILVF